MLRWAVPAAFIVAIEYCVAFLIGARVGFHYTIPFRSFATIGIAFAVVGLFTAFAVRLGHLFFTDQANPTRRLIKDAPKLSGFIVGCLLTTASWAVLNWHKIMLPIAHPFWADPMLADMDKAIFGVDPWRLTHSLGELRFLDTVYVSWGPVMSTIIVVLVCLPESRRKAQAMLAYFLILAIGTLSQHLFSSAGPIFYQQIGLGDRFADLPIQPWVRTAADYIWGDYLRAGGRIGSGISAMPSMHVALAAWVALVVRTYLPRLQFVAWAWVGLIVVGSVHLGWHYAVDGIAALAITAASWKLASAVSSLPVGQAIVTSPVRGIAPAI